MADLVIARTSQGGTVTTGQTIIGFDDIEFQTVPTLVTTGASWHFTARNDAVYAVNATVTLTGIGSVDTLITLLKNGAADAEAEFRSAPVPVRSFQIAKHVVLKATETISIAIVLIGAGSGNLEKDGLLNWITIYELP